MARGAVLKPRIQHVMVAPLQRHSVIRPAEVARSVMAFETDREDHRPSQQFDVRRSVRDVARLTAIHTHASMLEDERASLIGVALYTRFFIAGLLID